MIAALRERGLERIVCEGGPRLVGQLLAARLVDEICLTTVPRLLGTASTLFGGATGGAADLDLVQLLADEGGALYARWRVVR